MKRNCTALLLALALATPALIASAQDAEKPRSQRPRDGQGEFQPPPDGERPRAQRPDGQGPGPGSQRPGGMRAPLIAALDANNDGEIDKREIEQASKALKKLDKNGDGKLTGEEIRRPRPGGPQGGQRPPDGQGYNRGGGQGRPDGPPPGDGGGQPRRQQRPPPEKE